MKTLPEILRDADPVASEAPRSLHERRSRRQMVLDRALARRDQPQRFNRGAITVVFAIVAVAAGWLSWSRTAVDVIAAVRFEIRLAEESFSPGLREAQVAKTTRRVYLHAEPVVVNSDIADARVIEGGNPSTFGVAVTFTARGGDRMLRATRDHIGRPLAILVDGQVVTAPTLRSPISTSAVMSGDYTHAEAERIASGIVGR